MIGARSNGVRTREGKMVRYVGAAIVPVAIAALPLVVHDRYIISVMVFIAIYGMVAIGLSLLMGYGGQISLGQAAFFAIGAYVSGILTAKHQVSPWLALVAAAIVTAIAALGTGAAILRFHGHVLAVATLALNIIVYTLLVELDSVTGGLSPGLGGIPRLSVGDLVLREDAHYYYLAWTFLGIIFVLSWNIVHSRVGRALRSMHAFYGGSEEAARSLGVDTASLKVKVFILSAIYASLGGSVYAHYITFLNPAPFDILLSLELLVMVILGGLRNLWGGVLGAGVVVALGEALREIVPRFIPNAFGEYQIIAYGAILIIVLIALPEGLVQIPTLLRLRINASEIGVDSKSVTTVEVER